MLVSSLDSSRLDSVGAIAYAMIDNRLEELFVKPLATDSVTFSSDGQHWLERLECLQGSLETDRSRNQVILAGSLGHDGSDKVVRQNMRPDFFPNKFGRFASKTFHLHDGLDAAQI